MSSKREQKKSPAAPSDWAKSFSALQAQSLRARLGPSAQAKLDEEFLSACQNPYVNSSWSGDPVINHKIEQLLDQGASIAAADSSGNGCLHKIAKGYGTPSSAMLLERLIEQLLLRGANPEARNTGNRTPLHTMSFNAQVSGAQGLIRASAKLGIALDLHAMDNGGDTPLHDAAASGSMEMVQLLMNSGGNALRKNKAGQRPDEIALARSRHEISSWMRAFAESQMLTEALPLPAAAPGPSAPKRPRL